MKRVCDDLSKVINSINDEKVFEELYMAIFVGDNKIFKKIEIPLIKKQIPLPIGDKFFRKNSKDFDEFKKLSLGKKECLEKIIRDKCSHSFLRNREWKDICYDACKKLNVPRVSNLRDSAFIMEHRLWLHLLIKAIKNNDNTKMRSIDILDISESNMLKSAKLKGTEFDAEKIIKKTKKIYEELRGIISESDKGMAVLVSKMLAGSFVQKAGNLIGWDAYQIIMFKLIYSFMGVTGSIKALLGIGAAGAIMNLATYISPVLATIAVCKTCYEIGGPAYRYIFPCIISIHMIERQLISEKIIELTEDERSWLEYKQDEFLEMFSNS